VKLLLDTDIKIIFISPWLLESITADLFVDICGDGAVSSRVFGEMVAAHKPLVALGARKPLLAGVSPDVPLQFVGPHESLTAEQPVAEKRTFPTVPAQVRLEVRRLGVDLAAAGHVAGVLSRRRRLRRRRFRRRRGGLTPSAVGAVADQAVGVAGMLLLT